MSSSPLPIRILKFGGTSLANADRIRAVVDVVRAECAEARCVVVVSAMGGVTEGLAQAAAAAAQGNAAYASLLQEILVRHDEAAAEVVSAAEREEISGLLEQWGAERADVLRGVHLVREVTPRTLDGVLALGELASATLVAAALRAAGEDAELADARGFLVSDGVHGGAHVDLGRSASRLGDGLLGGPAIPVVTGFIAATESGETTTLGRGGSDYTAAVLGALLGAERVEIWTDVDGVMSADPRLVPDAFSLEALGYAELLELSHFGAKVVHPASVHPARDHDIPLLIRNTLRPEFPGTWVRTTRAARGDRPVRGISSIRQVALLRLEGNGMVGVPGIAERLFRALARNDVSIILISQASSEHSICFAVDPAHLDRTRRAIADEFRLEREVGIIDELAVDDDRSIIAAVGEGMRDTPGIAGRLFSILGDLGVNVHAIAQGSSELNISLVVERADMERALRGLHTAFFPTPRTEVRMYLAGVGGVGGALLEQVARVAPVLERERGIALRVVGVASSARGLLDASGVALGAGCPPELVPMASAGAALVDAAVADRSAVRVFVDCTADAGLPASYRRLLDSGAAVVCANKRGFSGAYDAYRSVREPRPGYPRAWLETTVGAGLPVLSTVEDLRATGDAILSVEGVLSGTLSFLFNEVMQGRPFSEAVRDARERGYTEPDPREDLSGQDVMRKLMILGREAGWRIEPEAVCVEPILPGEGWAELSVDEFMDRLPEVDGHFEALRAAAAARNGRLCHLASVSEGVARVWVGEVDPEHPCHGLRGADNLVAIRTARYPNPLVVRGAGAGRDVTAAGVLADVVRAGMARPSSTMWYAGREVGTVEPA